MNSTVPKPFALQCHPSESQKVESTVWYKYNTVWNKGKTPREEVYVPKETTLTSLLNL